jgi:tetratricopeptide (TPR) repeat protein
MAPAYRPKLKVFISSTIHECRADRNQADRAIESLSQSSFRFETEGAIPHPPRAVYLSALRDSDVFLGVYRKQYGWIAPDMSISGVEDEFEIALELGLPRFIYVHADAEGRDPRLSGVLDSLQGLTYYKFDQHEDLFERIRSDLGSELARRWHLAHDKQVSRTQTAAKILEKSAPATSRIVRVKVIADLAGAVRRRRIVEVNGALGSGKSVLLASLAESCRWPFLSSPDSFRDAIYSIVGGVVTPGEQSWELEFEDAIEAVASWSKEAGNAIVVDGCLDGTLIGRLTEELTRRGGQPHIAFSCAVSHGGMFERFDVPRFTALEVAEYLEKRTGVTPDREAIEDAERKSSGLPLYLRLLAGESGGDGTLEDLERARFGRLPTNARELVSFLAVAEGALPLAVAQDLMGVHGFEPFREVVRVAEDLVAHDGEAIELVHAHVRQTVRLVLAGEPNRIRLQARAVMDALLASGATVSAVMVGLAHGLSVSLKRLRRGAADAAIVSDMASVARIEVARRELLRKDEKHRAELVHSSISLAAALSEIGREGEAEPVWAEARSLALAAQDGDLLRVVDDMMAARAAMRTFSQADVGNVVKRKEEALAAGDTVTEARLTVDLSTIYLRIREYEKVITHATRARDLFKELGDVHGVTVALRNLGGALLSIPGREDEGRAVLETLGDATGLSQREEAWWLNLQCRLLRKEGRNEEAAVLCERAIALGEKMNDRGIVAINSTNRGNVAADLGDKRAAAYWYSRASAAAKEAGSVSSEAFASMRMAELWAAEDPMKAEPYASHAVTLLHGTAATDDLARALRVLGTVQADLGRIVDAAKSFAAAVLTGAVDQPSAFRLFGRAFELLSQADGWVTAVTRILKWVSGEEISEIVQAANQLAIELTRRLPGPGGAQLAGLVFRQVTRAMPPAVRRRFFRLSVRVLVDHATGPADLWPLIGLIRCDFRGAVVPEDIQLLGDRLHRRDIGLSFRLYEQGEVALCVAVARPAGDLWVTVDQLDQNVESAMVAVLIWLFLGASSGALVETLLADMEVRRSGVNVKVVAFSEAKNLDMPIAEDELGPGGAVTRPTVLGDDVPTVVVFRDGIFASEERALLHLLASTVTEVTIQFLGREIDKQTSLEVVMRAVRPLFTVSGADHFPPN